MDAHPVPMARRPWLPLLVMLGLLFVLGGWVGWQWQTLTQGAEQEHERLFQTEVDYIEHRLRERMQAYEMVLRGLSGLTGLTSQVSPEEWQQATDRLLLQETYPGIQALNYARYVTDAELPQLVDYVQSYRPDFRVWPPSNTHEHVVVKYTHPPLWRNRQVLGYDLLSDPIRRQALLRARDTGYPTLTGPLRLLQETTQSVQPGVLLVLPIYRGGVSLATLNDRQGAFIGTLYGAFRLNDLIEGVLSERLDQFDIQLFDAAEPSLPLLQGKTLQRNALFQTNRALELYGRHWRLSIASTADYEATLKDRNRTFGLVAGLLAAVLFALMVGGYLWLRERALAGSRAQSLQLQEREARFRLLIERLPVATLLANRTGQIELANQSAADLLGSTVEELLGHRVSYYLPGVMHGAEVVPDDLEVQAQLADGTKVPVTLHVTPLSQLEALHYLINLVDLRAFKRAEERFRQVVEGLPNAFLLVNGDGRIVMVNRQTEVLLGYPREELLGEPIERLLPETMRQAHVALRSAFLRQPEPSRIGSNREVYGLHRDGRQIPLEIGLAPLQSGDEVLVQAVLIDVSHRRAAELRLRDQADQLAVANRYKSEFLANMSHELRTPLNSILILSDQLRRNAAGNLSDKQVRHADIIHHAGTDLLQMINDVLDLSRIDAGRLQIVVAPVELEGLLQEVADSMRPLAEDKGLRLEVHIEPEVPASFVSDRARLHQVLRNLVANAITFTERGSVSLVARCAPPLEPQAAGCRYLRLEVRDTGIGIPADQHTRIFQAFQQIDGSISRQHGGAGLGLAISRQLVELLRGRIFLESTPGVGSCFTVELPLELADDASGDPDAGAGQLLLLTRDPDCAELVAEVVEAQGFGTLRQADIEPAIEAMRQRAFRAVLIDLEHVDGDGWQLYRSLRRDPAHHDVPVIVLSGTPPAGNWHDGALYHLRQPVSRVELQRLCLQLLSREAGGRRLLLVEADPERARRLRNHFEQHGYNVTLTGQSDEARLAFAAQDYAAVVVDFDMPGGEGRDLLFALNRLRPFNKENQVIVYSQEPVSELDLEQLPFPVSALSRNDVEERLETLLQQAEGAVPAPAEAVGEPLLGRRVLLFDSEVRSIFLLSGLLDTLGLQSVAATTLDEALTRFEESAFDLVLLSVERPQDARQLIEQLREEHGCQVPILCLVSAPCDDQALSGADDCLPKPVEGAGLGAFIQRWIGRSPGAGGA